MRLQIIYNMYKKDLTLNNLQWLICQKNQHDQIIIWIKNCLLNI